MAWATKTIRLGDAFPEVSAEAADQTVTIIPMNWLPISTARKLMANMSRLSEIEQGNAGESIDEQVSYAERAMGETEAMFADTLPLIVESWTLCDDAGEIPDPKTAKAQSTSFTGRVPTNVLQWIMGSVMEGEQEIPPTNASPSSNTSSVEAQSTNEPIDLRPSLQSPVVMETNESVLPTPS